MKSPQLLILAILLCYCLPLPAAVIYVNPLASGNNTGGSWSHAFADLQSALTIAQSGDEIWVFAAEYFPTSGSDRYATFSIPPGVALYGGFTGTETARDQRDWESYPTFLNGNIGSGGSRQDNSYTVVTFTDPDSGNVLDGFHIVNGVADDRAIETHTYDPARRGAGMLILTTGEMQDYLLTLRNCMFMDNEAENGGAIFGDARYRNNIALQVINCTFERNRAEAGASYSSDAGSTGTGGVLFEKCQFKKNVNRYGGNIYFLNEGLSGHFTFRECLFAENESEQIDITAFNRESAFDLDIQQCVFLGNFDAEGIPIMIDFQGGSGSEMKLDQCSFENNRYRSIFIGASKLGVLEVTNSSFSNNTVGPLLEGYPQKLLMDSCVIRDNEFDEILLASREAVIEQIDFVDNDASDLLRINSRDSRDPGSWAVIRECRISGSTGGNLLDLAADSIVVDQLFLVDDEAADEGAIQLSARKMLMTNSLLARLSNGMTKEAIQTRSDDLEMNIVNSTLYNYSFLHARLTALGQNWSPDTTLPRIRLYNSIIWSDSLLQQPLFTLRDGHVELWRSLINSPACDSSYVLDDLNVQEPVIGTFSCDDQTLFGQDPRFQDIAALDFSLHPCSPAVNWGELSHYPGTPLVDLVGQARVFGAGIDLGALELQEQQEPLSITVDVLPASGAAQEDGRITVLEVSGGTPAYSYNWSNGATTGSIEALAPGEYQLTITDQEGCSGTYTYVLDFTSAVIDPAVQWGASLFPNPVPAGSAGTLRFAGGSGEVRQLRLWSVQKQLLWQNSIGDRGIQEIKVLSPGQAGIYLLELMDKHGERGYLKLLVR